MANICDNKFYFSCEKNGGSWIKKFKQIFEEELEGELTWSSNADEENSDGVELEGWFTSRWNFPDKIFGPLFEGTEDDIYFRCLSEEYGCEYVAMNIFNEGYWCGEQTFDL